MNDLIATQAEIAALPAGTLVRSADIEFGVGTVRNVSNDIWRLDGGYLAACISAGDYRGPISEIALPATVL